MLQAHCPHPHVVISDTHKLPVQRHDRALWPAACWMGWPGGPDAKYLWREGAKPAEAQYANIAATISQFEPVQLLANPGQVGVELCT